MEEKRDLARELAQQHYAAGDPLGWFDALYRSAGGDFGVIPWADRAVNPHLAAWCEREAFPRQGCKTLVVGCGLGDDAEYLAARGAEVTAFDLSPTAIEWCRRRFPASPVRYETANLLEYKGNFDLVVEIYTLQAMPLELRPRAIAAVGSLGRELLIICRGREESDPPGQLPFPLTKSDLAAIPLPLVRLEDFDDPFDPGKRRFRAHWRT
ncbi:MAG TPA: class I SAM-dependent methyltransferase [Bryobacteraceae bacterium]|nr:class I SAM-dependent methyltransferase [Bryobacteraceae bacterium]